MPEAIYSPVQPILSIAKELVITSLPVRIALHCLRLHHECWWLYHKQRTYSDPSNWICLAGGYVLNYTIARIEFIKCSIQVYTIALRIYRLIRELGLLQQALTDFSNAITDGQRLRSLVSWRTPTIDYFRRIKDSAIHTATSMLNVSSRCIEVYDAFYMKKNNEIVLDLLEGLKEFQKDKEKVKVALSSIIVKIVPLISSSVNPETIVAAVEDGIEKASNCKEVATKAAEIAWFAIDKVGPYMGAALRPPECPKERLSVSSAPIYAAAAGHAGVYTLFKNPTTIAAPLALALFGLYDRLFCQDKDGR